MTVRQGDCRKISDFIYASHDSCCGILRIVSNYHGYSSEFTIKEAADHIKELYEPGMLHMAVVVVKEPSGEQDKQEYLFQRALERCRFTAVNTWINPNTKNTLVLYTKIVRKR